MPDMYQPTPTYTNTNKVPLTQKKKLNLTPLGKTIGIIAITAVLAFVSIFLSGFLSAFSANITIQNGLTYFDPLITVSYLVVFYFLSYVYPFTNKQRGYYFFLSLALSFTINFVEGTLLLISLYPILKKLKLIESVAS
jgi:hypothetical protein